MARTFVESGATQIVILDLNQAEADTAARELAEWFVAEGEAAEGEIEAVGLACNVADEESVKAAFGAIKDKFGRLDVLVTAAGIVENFVAAEYPTEKVRKLLDINVMGTWFCAREAAKLMPEGGSVVLIGSMSGSVSPSPRRSGSKTEVEVETVKECWKEDSQVAKKRRTPRKQKKERPELTPDRQHPSAADPLQLL